MYAFSKNEASLLSLFVFSIIIVVSSLLSFNYLRQLLFVEHGFIYGTFGKINVDVSGKFENHGV